MKKILFMLYAFLPTVLLSQIFEKHVYPITDEGDVTLRESIITQSQSTTTYCSAGFYYFDQGSGGYYRPVLYNRNPDGTTNFNNSYVLKGPVSGTYNAKSYAVAEDSVYGFITVGTISDYGGNTVNGGGDILLLKYDGNGVLTESKHIDFGYNEVAYDIINKDENYNKFIICGTAKRPTGSEVFIAEIDRNLNVTWVTRLALKISEGAQPDANLFSLTMDENETIWAVGDIDNGSDKDYLLLAFESVFGSYALGRTFYNSTDIEIMNDVASASNGLIIMTGQSKKTNNSRNRMSILRYDKWQGMLQSMQFLRTSDANGQKSNIGYEIMQTVDPSTNLRAYYVVGSSTSTGDGLSDGVVYYLNDIFSPTWQVLFESNSHVSLYDADFMNESGNGYMNFSGSHGVNGSYSAGFDVKIPMDGYSYCSEPIDKDTIETTLEIGYLMDSVYSTYSIYSMDTTAYPLNDSVACEDNIEQRQERFVSLTDQKMLFPNPLVQGEELNCSSRDGAGRVVIYSLTGQIVFERIFGADELIKIQSGSLPDGTYIFQFFDSDGIVIFNEKLVILK